MNIVLTGGGTGGHTVVGIAVADALREYFSKTGKENGFNLLYVGNVNGSENSYCQKKEINFKSVPTGKLRRYFSFHNFIDFFKIIFGIVKAFFILLRFKPNVIFSGGGYVSIPVVIAGFLLRIPIVIHEQTVNVGLANKIASVFAKKVCLSFERAGKFFPQKKIIHTGQPIRKELFNGSKQNLQKKIPFDETLPIIYITGGAQGSHKINMVIKSILPEILKNSNVIHQCGKHPSHNDFEEMKRLKNELPENLSKRYFAYDFIYDELPDILNSCDLLIGRSGAGTVNEVIALKIPSIFVPLAIATKNEQYENAKIISDIGSAKIIEEKKLNGQTLLSSINELITDAHKLENMKHNLEKLTGSNADKKIVDVILSLST